MSDDVFNIVGTLQDEAFRIDEVVAEGGFAVVYRAYHQGFRADVALKCLKVPRALTSAQQEEFLERFREEGELLFRLSAAIPAVVRPLHLGTVKTDRAKFVPFIALEWLEGQTLDQLIRKRTNQHKPPLDLVRAVRLLTPAARALERAHRFPMGEGTVSILHRDIKPENLFVATAHGDASVKILDFGIGKVKSVATQLVGQASVDEEAMSAFTPAYAAPEQWLPKRFGQTGPWTDVFGFALTLVETLTGTCPFDGDAHAVMGAALDEGQRPTPGNLGVILPAQAEAAFQRALAVDPKQRLQDVGEFWDALESAAQLPTSRVAEVTPALASDPPPHTGPRALETRRLSGGARVPAIPDLDLAPPPSAAERPSRRERLRPVSAMEEGIPLTGGFRAEDVGVDLGGAPAVMPRIARSGSSVASSPTRARSANLVEQRRVLQARESLLRRLMEPARWLIVAIVIMLLDWGISQAMGHPLQLGPVRAFWLAGPLAAYGMIRLIAVLMD